MSNLKQGQLGQYHSEKKHKLGHVYLVENVKYATYEVTLRALDNKSSRFSCSQGHVAPLWIQPGDFGWMDGQYWEVQSWATEMGFLQLLLLDVGENIVETYTLDKLRKDFYYDENQS